jgi:hypothetical protein
MTTANVPSPRPWRPTALWSAAIVLALGLAALAVLAVRERRQRHDAAIEEGGIRAVLELAEIGKSEVEQYLGWEPPNCPPDEPRPVRANGRLSRLPRMSVPGMQIYGAAIFILSGEESRDCALIASTGMVWPPTVLHNRPPEVPLQAAKCRRGAVRLKDGSNVPGWQFEAPVAVQVGRGDKAVTQHGRAVLILIEERQ